MVPSAQVDCGADAPRYRNMLSAIFILFQAILLVCGGHQAVALERVALRQQMAALKRAIKHSPLRERDRLFRTLLSTEW